MPAAVEDRRGDADLRCALGEQHADLLRLGRLVHELREHVPGRPGDHQPGARRAPGDLLPYPEVATRARLGARGGAAGDAAVRPGPGARHLLLPSLPDLAADLLALVPHALALVRVGLA